jgi:hypothetical protein
MATRYEQTIEIPLNGNGGFSPKMKTQKRVIELEDDEPVPRGAVEVPLATPLSTFEDVTLTNTEQQQIAVLGPSKPSGVS